MSKKEVVFLKVADNFVPTVGTKKLKVTNGSESINVYHRFQSIPQQNIIAEAMSLIKENNGSTILITSSETASSSPELNGIEPLKTVQKKDMETHKGSAEKQQTEEDMKNLVDKILEDSFDIIDKKQVEKEDHEQEKSSSVFLKQRLNEMIQKIDTARAQLTPKKGQVSPDPKTPSNQKVKNRKFLSPLSPVSDESSPSPDRSPTPEGKGKEREEEDVGFRFEGSLGEKLAKESDDLKQRKELIKDTLKKTLLKVKEFNPHSKKGKMEKEKGLEMLKDLIERTDEADESEIPDLETLKRETRIQDDALIKLRKEDSLAFAEELRQELVERGFDLDDLDDETGKEDEFEISKKHQQLNKSYKSEGPKQTPGNKKFVSKPLGGMNDVSHIAKYTLTGKLKSFPHKKYTLY
jgi:hypothetical protein